MFIHYTTDLSVVIAKVGSLVYRLFVNAMQGDLIQTLLEDKGMLTYEAESTDLNQVF